MTARDGCIYCGLYAFLAALVLALVLHSLWSLILLIPGIVFFVASVFVGDDNLPGQGPQ
jgi:hypothetical protein